MIRILFVGGPPGSGKTESQNAFKDHKDTVLYTELSWMMKSCTHVHYGVSKHFPDPYFVVNHDHFEDVKDEPNDWFGGKTPREAYIHFSEVITKPVKGQNYFGKESGNYINHQIHTKGYKNIVMGGVGFKDEMIGFIDEIRGKALEPVVMTFLQLYRDGHNYEKDSRTRLNIDEINEHYPDNPIREVKYHNTESTKELHQAVRFVSGFVI